MKVAGSTFAMFFSLVVGISTFSRAAWSQQSAENTMEGTVISAGRETMVVRGDDNHHQLFVFERSAQRPRSIAPGTRVSVVSVPGQEPGVRYASSVTVLSAPSQSTAQTGAEAPAPLPRQVRDLERDIERESKRWRIGIRGGVALDPELVLIGAHAQLGPFFSRNLTFRPNAEFDWGEVTKLFAINLDSAYRLPITQPAAPYSIYVGAGPSFTFLHENFERFNIPNPVDFGNFEFDTGLNVFSGVQFRRGTFFEVKTTVYSGPTPSLRLIFGYNF